MYHLVYYIGNTRKEVIRYNAPRALCMYLKRQLSNSTHRMGYFRLEPVRLTIK